MEASTILWDKWQEQLDELLPEIHGHQRKTLALSVLGIVLSGSAVLSRMAESLSLQDISSAKMPSIERRLARFVGNSRVQVNTIWKQVLSQSLPYWKGKAVRVILDGMPLDERVSIVYLGLLVQSRVLPLAWRVMPAQEKWERRQWELVGEMLDEVGQHLEPSECTLIADRGLAGSPLVSLCRDRKWHYVLRVCKNHTCRRWMGEDYQPSQPLGQIIAKEGQQWFGKVLLWQGERMIQTELSAIWQTGYTEAWFLISDLPAGRPRVHDYALRMRVESTFQDSKSRGWNLKMSQIEERAQLDRLLLALFVAMWWVAHLAAACIHHGKRHQFDRHDRRDKGIFRLGRLWLLDILRRDRTTLALIHCLPFRKTPTGWCLALRF